MEKYCKLIKIKNKIEKDEEYIRKAVEQYQKEQNNTYKEYDKSNIYNEQFESYRKLCTQLEVEEIIWPNMQEYEENTKIEFLTVKIEGMEEFRAKIQENVIAIGVIKASIEVTKIEVMTHSIEEVEVKKAIVATEVIDRTPKVMEVTSKAVNKDNCVTIWPWIEAKEKLREMHEVDTIQLNNRFHALEDIMEPEEEFEYEEEKFYVRAYRDIPNKKRQKGMRSLNVQERELYKKLKYGKLEEKERERIVKEAEKNGIFLHQHRVGILKGKWKTREPYSYNEQKIKTQSSKKKLRCGDVIEGLPVISKIKGTNLYKTGYRKNSRKNEREIYKATVNRKWKFTITEDGNVFTRQMAYTEGDIYQVKEYTGTGQVLEINTVYKIGNNILKPGTALEFSSVVRKKPEIGTLKAKVFSKVKINEENKSVMVKIARNLYNREGIITRNFTRVRFWRYLLGAAEEFVYMDSKDYGGYTTIEGIHTFNVCNDKKVILDRAPVETTHEHGCDCIRKIRVSAEVNQPNAGHNIEEFRREFSAYPEKGSSGYLYENNEGDQFVINGVFIDKYGRKNNYSEKFYVRIPVDKLEQMDIQVLCNIQKEAIAKVIKMKGSDNEWKYLIDVEKMVFVADEKLTNLYTYEGDYPIWCWHCSGKEKKIATILSGGKKYYLKEAGKAPKGKEDKNDVRLKSGTPENVKLMFKREVRDEQTRGEMSPKPKIAQSDVRLKSSAPEKKGAREKTEQTRGEASPKTKVVQSKEWDQEPKPQRERRVRRKATTDIGSHVLTLIVVLALFKCAVAKSVVRTQWYLADDEGLEVNRILNLRGKNRSLHGIWPEKNCRGEYKPLKEEEAQILYKSGMLDSSQETNYTCCNLQKQEWGKHGWCNYKKDNWLTEMALTAKLLSEYSSFVECAVQCVNRKGINYVQQATFEKQEIKVGCVEKDEYSFAGIRSRTECRNSHSYYSERVIEELKVTSMAILDSTCSKELVDLLEVVEYCRETNFCYSIRDREIDTCSGCFSGRYWLRKIMALSGMYETSASIEGNCVRVRNYRKCLEVIEDGLELVEYKADNCVEKEYINKGIIPRARAESDYCKTYIKRGDLLKVKNCLPKGLPCGSKILSNKLIKIGETRHWFAEHFSHELREEVLALLYFGSLVGLEELSGIILASYEIYETFFDYKEKPLNNGTGIRNITECKKMSDEIPAFWRDENWNWYVKDEGIDWIYEKRSQNNPFFMFIKNSFIIIETVIHDLIVATYNLLNGDIIILVIFLFEIVRGNVFSALIWLLLVGGVDGTTFYVRTGDKKEVIYFKMGCKGHLEWVNASKLTQSGPITLSIGNSSEIRCMQNNRVTNVTIPVKNCRKYKQQYFICEGADWYLAETYKEPGESKSKLIKARFGIEKMEYGDICKHYCGYEIMFEKNKGKQDDYFGICKRNNLQFFSKKGNSWKNILSCELVENATVGRSGIECLYHGIYIKIKLIEQVESSNNSVIPCQPIKEYSHPGGKGFFERESEVISWARRTKGWIYNETDPIWLTYLRDDDYQYWWVSGTSYRQAQLPNIPLIAGLALFRAKYTMIVVAVILAIIEQIEASPTEKLSTIIYISHQTEHWILVTIILVYLYKKLGIEAITSLGIVVAIIKRHYMLVILSILIGQIGTVKAEDFYIGVDLSGENCWLIYALIAIGCYEIAKRLETSKAVTKIRLIIWMIEYSMISMIDTTFKLVLYCSLAVIDKLIKYSIISDSIKFKYVENGKVNLLLFRVVVLNILVICFGNKFIIFWKVIDLFSILLVELAAYKEHQRKKINKIFLLGLKLIYYTRIGLIDGSFKRIVKRRIEKVHLWYCMSLMIVFILVIYYDIQWLIVVGGGIMATLIYSHNKESEESLFRPKHTLTNEFYSKFWEYYYYGDGLCLTDQPKERKIIKIAGKVVLFTENGSVEREKILKGDSGSLLQGLPIIAVKNDLVLCGNVGDSVEYLVENGWTLCGPGKSYNTLEVKEHRMGFTKKLSCFVGIPPTRVPTNKTSQNLTLKKVRKGLKTGWAFSKMGGTMSALHVTGDKPLIESDEMLCKYRKPTLVDQGHDEISYGMVSQKEPKLGSIYQVFNPEAENIQGEPGALVLLKRIEAGWQAVTEKGEPTYYSIEDLKGWSGLPIYDPIDGEIVGIVKRGYSSRKIGTQLLDRQQSKRAVTEVKSKMEEFLDMKKGEMRALVMATGAGKSTQFPKYLYDSMRKDKKILVCIPLKAATANVYKYMRERYPGTPIHMRAGGVKQGDESLGGIIYATYGMLCRMNIGVLKQYLSTFEYVLLDEYHCATAEQIAFISKIYTIKSSTKVIAMTATPTGLVSTEGAKFEIHEEYLKPYKEGSEEIEIMGYKIDREILERNTLVFLPTKNLCEQTASKLNKDGIRSMAYYSGKEVDELNDFVKAGKYVIVATNAIESGVTLPDLINVIDSGRVVNKVVTFSNSCPYISTHLCQQQITMEEAGQRRGRVGRTQEGFYYKMESRSTNVRDNTYSILSAQIYGIEEEKGMTQMFLEMNTNWGLYEQDDHQLQLMMTLEEIIRTKAITNYEGSNLERVESDEKIRYLYNRGIYPAWPVFKKESKINSRNIMNYHLVKNGPYRCVYLSIEDLEDMPEEMEVNEDRSLLNQEYKDIYDELENFSNFNIGESIEKLLAGVLIGYLGYRFIAGKHIPYVTTEYTLRLEDSSDLMERFYTPEGIVIENLNADTIGKNIESVKRMTIKAAKIVRGKIAEGSEKVGKIWKDNDTDKKVASVWKYLKEFLVIHWKEISEGAAWGAHSALFFEIENRMGNYVAAMTMILKYLLTAKMGNKMLVGKVAIDLIVGFLNNVPEFKGDTNCKERGQRYTMEVIVSAISSYVLDNYYLTLKELTGAGALEKIAPYGNLVMKMFQGSSIENSINIASIIYKTYTCMTEGKTEGMLSQSICVLMELAGTKMQHMVIGVTLGIGLISLHNIMERMEDKRLLLTKLYIKDFVSQCAMEEIEKLSTKEIITKLIGLIGLATNPLKVIYMLSRRIRGKSVLDSLELMAGKNLYLLILSELIVLGEFTESEIAQLSKFDSNIVLSKLIEKFKSMFMTMVKYRIPIWDCTAIRPIPYSAQPLDWDYCHIKCTCGREKVFNPNMECVEDRNKNICKNFSVPLVVYEELIQNPNPNFVHFYKTGEEVRGNMCLLGREILIRTRNLQVKMVKETVGRYWIKATDKISYEKNDLKEAMNLNGDIIIEGNCVKGQSFKDETIRRKLAILMGNRIYHSKVTKGSIVILGDIYMEKRDLEVEHVEMGINFTELKPGKYVYLEPNEMECMKRKVSHSNLCTMSSKGGPEIEPKLRNGHKIGTNPFFEKEYIYCNHELPSKKRKKVEIEYETKVYKWLVPENLTFRDIKNLVKERVPLKEEVYITVNGLKVEELNQIDSYGDPIKLSMHNYKKKRLTDIIWDWFIHKDPEEASEAIGEEVEDNATQPNSNEIEIQAEKELTIECFREPERTKRTIVTKNITIAKFCEELKYLDKKSGNNTRVLIKVCNKLIDDDSERMLTDFGPENKLECHYEIVEVDELSIISIRKPERKVIPILKKILVEDIFSTISKVKPRVAEGNLVEINEVMSKGLEIKVPINQVDGKLEITGNKLPIIENIWKIRRAIMEYEEMPTEMTSYTIKKKLLKRLGHMGKSDLILKNSLVVGKINGRQLKRIECNQPNKEITRLMDQVGIKVANLPVVRAVTNHREFTQAIMEKIDKPENPQSEDMHEECFRIWSYYRKRNKIQGNYDEVSWEELENGINRKGAAGHLEKWTNVGQILDSGKKVVENRIKEIAGGILEDYYETAMPKNEKRDVEDDWLKGDYVNYKKPRVIQYPEAEIRLATTKVLYKWVKQKPIVIPGYEGKEPIFNIFMKIKESLRKYSKPVIVSFDTKAWDTQVTSKDLELVARIQKDLYKKKWHRFIDTLVREMKRPLVVTVEGDCFIRNAERGSGQPDTSAGNSILNSLIMIRAFCKSNSIKFEKFFDLAEIHVCGDDGFIITEEILGREFSKKGPMILMSSGKPQKLLEDGCLAITSNFEDMEFCSHQPVGCEVNDGVYYFAGRPTAIILGKMATRLSESETRSGIGYEKQVAFSFLLLYPWNPVVRRLCLLVLEKEGNSTTPNIEGQLEIKFEGDPIGAFEDVYGFKLMDVKKVVNTRTLSKLNYSMNFLRIWKEKTSRRLLKMCIDSEGSISKADSLVSEKTGIIYRPERGVTYIIGKYEEIKIMKKKFELEVRKEGILAKIKRMVKRLEPFITKLKIN